MSLGRLWFTTAAQGANHNIPPCWNWMRNPIVCRIRSPSPDAIFTSRCRWSSSPKRHASARASSVACFASKPGNRLRRRSRTSGWRPPGWRWSKGGAPSKPSRWKPASGTGSACAERSYALLGKRRRRFATRRTRSLPSDPESLQSVPQDQAERVGGAGTDNLPLEHRIAQRITVGERQPASSFSCCARIWTLNRVNDFRR